jgi:hypothetical protein
MDSEKPTSNGFTDTFFTKLKEQSFTIILLVGILYYQNTTFNQQLEEYKKMISEKEELILKLTDDERQRLIERSEYLMDQRDKYVEELIDSK